MSPNESDSLEEYWDDLRPRQLVKTEWPSTLEASLDVACEKALENMKRAMQIHLRNLPEQDHGWIEQIADRGMRGLKDIWLNELATKDTAGLIEFILQGQGNRLTSYEMRAFIHALPRTLLARICASTFHTANGVHALMGLEVARRDHLVSDYTITYEKGRTRVDFEHPTEGGIRFYLDEGFDIIEDRMQHVEDLEDIPF